MRHKILILNLLLSLVFLPVAQAMSPNAAPAEHGHGIMVMDCGQVDPAHCIDFDACVSDNHASCDLNLKAAQVLSNSLVPPGTDTYARDLAERILSHHPERLLRPPRNA